jgi:hypothetical protein
VQTILERLHWKLLGVLEDVTYGEMTELIWLPHYVFTVKTVHIMHKNTDLNARYIHLPTRQKPLMMGKYGITIIKNNIYLPPENNIILLKCLVFF